MIPERTGIGGGCRALVPDGFADVP
jgi:hypothetical protein